MKIYRKSYFKNPGQDKKWLEDWVTKLEELNKKKYCRVQIETSLGSTCIWGLNLDCTHAETLVIFPGARTTALFWDFDNGLNNLGDKYRIYLVETNGLPNLSSGNTPDIKLAGYGEWANEIFDKLNIQSSYIAGASFGGLICMKLSIIAPEKVK